MDLKVFNLTSGVNEVGLLVQHELFEWKWRLNECVFNTKRNEIIMNVGVVLNN